MCTIENNYIYNSTFNLFYAVYDTKNKKIAQNKSKCDTATFFCVLQKPITCNSTFNLFSAVHDKNKIK